MVLIRYFYYVFTGFYELKSSNPSPCVFYWYCFLLFTFLSLYLIQQPFVFSSSPIKIPLRYWPFSFVSISLNPTRLFLLLPFQLVENEYVYLFYVSGSVFWDFVVLHKLLDGSQVLFNPRSPFHWTLSCDLCLRPQSIRSWYIWLKSEVEHK